MPDSHIVGTDDVYSGRLQHIQHHPEEHQHEDLAMLTACSLVAIPGGGVAVDARLFEAHEEFAPLGTNGGVRCDVRKGPCSCGAWH